SKRDWSSDVCSSDLPWKALYLLHSNATRRFNDVSFYFFQSHLMPVFQSLIKLRIIARILTGSCFIDVKFNMERIMEYHEKKSLSFIRDCFLTGNGVLQ